MAGGRAAWATNGARGVCAALRCPLPSWLPPLDCTSSPGHTPCAGYCHVGHKVLLKPDGEVELEREWGKRVWV